VVCASPEDDLFVFDICAPVPAPDTAVGRVKPGQRPSVKLVRTVYHSPYDGAWREFSGHACAGSERRARSSARLTQPASLASLHLRKQVPPYRTQCARYGAPQVAKSN
jgi:hypothetical protein